MTNLKTRIAAAVGAAALLALGAGCSEARTDSTQQAARYSGGATQVEEFKNCQSEPKLDYGSPGDHVYYYPSAQRTFSFTDDPNARAEAPPLTVPTADSQQMTVRGFITFTMTKDCEKLRAFHELIGKRMGADFPQGAQEDDDGGWGQFLAQYFKNPIDVISDAAAVKYTWKQLYYDTTVTQAFEKSVSSQLAAEINSKVGDGVIVINAVDIQRPEPPAELLEATQAGEKARAEGDARVAKVNADKRVAAAQTELAKQQAKTQAQCKQVHTSRECMILELAEKDQLKNLPPEGGITLRQQAQ